GSFLLRRDGAGPPALRSGGDEVTLATSVDRDLAFRYCVRLARAHPENFFIGSLFLPRAKRRHLAAVYAYARLADDIADGDLPTAEKLAALDCWEERLD